MKRIVMYLSVGVLVFGGTVRQVAAEQQHPWIYVSTNQDGSVRCQAAACLWSDMLCC